jgi:hypothetical protein
MIQFQVTYLLTLIIFQFYNEDKEAFAEVYYYFQLQIFDDLRTLALISVYSAPDPTLWELSHKTIKSCQYLADAQLVVIDVKTIHSVVAMVPHKVILPGKAAIEERWFVVEKPGLEAVEIGGFVEDIDKVM